MSAMSSMSSAFRLTRALAGLLVLTTALSGCGGGSGPEGGQGNGATTTTPTPAPAQWQAVGRRMFSEGNIYRFSMTLDGHGVPYVAYMEWNYGVRVMRFDGATWVQVGSRPLFGPFVESVAIAMGAGDIPFVAANTTIMRFDGSEWVAVGSGGFSNQMATRLALAVHGSTPYVSYYVVSYTGPSELGIKKLDGASWVSLGQPSFGWSPAIAIAGDGTPFVAAGCQTARFNGTSWETLPGTGFTAESTAALRLEGNTPYLACMAYYTYSAFVARYEGGTWVPLGEPSSVLIPTPMGPYERMSFAVRGGRPSFAYSNSFNTSVVAFDGTAWGHVGTPSIGAETPSDIFLEIDGAGAWYLGFLEFRWPTVLKYTP
jgi:hypothetical protein